MTDPEAARLALEPLLGPVEAVRIVETFYRPTDVVEDAGEPAPLVVPFARAAAASHVLDVAEAWAVGAGAWSAGTCTRARLLMPPSWAAMCSSL